MRSRTTMMMHCLEAGGMNPLWDSERDDWAKGNEVEINPASELREITNATFESFWQNPAQYDGRLIKVITKYGYLRLPSWQYRVLLMIRDPEEIRQSFFRIFGKPLMFTGDKDVPLTNELYYHIINGVMSDLTEQNIPFIPLQSKLVLERPQGTFRYLKQQGWPIDPDKAAAMVRPELRHIAVN